MRRKQESTGGFSGAARSLYAKYLSGAEDDQSNTLKSKSNVKQTAQKSSSPALVTRKPTLRQPPPTQAPFSSIQHHPQPAAVQQSGQTRSSIPARYPDYGERDEEGAEVSDELEEFPPTVPLRPAVADRERGGRQRERDLEGRGTSSLSSSSGRGAAVSVPVRGLRGESERERRGVVDPSATATDDVPSSVTHMTFASEPSSKHNFSVNMDRLTTDWLDVTELPPPLRNALTFVCLTTFPRDSRVTRLHLPAAPSSWSDGKSRDYCLVLDLDETLMHCSATPLKLPADLEVHFDDLDTVGYVYFRPFAKLFLEVVSKMFEVVIFTASTKAYADQVLNKLDPTGDFLHHRLYRTHCTEVCGAFCKDLRTLGRPMDRTILVDNSPISVAMQPDHGILIGSWMGDYKDKQLIDLLLFLQHMLQQSGCKVPEVLRDRYGLREWLESDAPLRCL